MQWAIYRFVYEPRKQRVHQVDGCPYSDTSIVMQRQGFRQVGDEALASLDEAMAVARKELDPKAQPCPLCLKFLWSDEARSEGLHWRR